MSRTAVLESLHFVPAAGWTRVAFTVVRAGKVAAAPDYRIERAAHPGQDILFCLAGAGEVATEGQRLDLRAGQLVWIANEGPHGHAADRRDPWTLLWFRLDGPNLAGLRRQIFGDGPSRVVFPQGLSPIPWFDRLFAALRSADGGLDLRLNVMVAEFLLMLDRGRAGVATRGLPAPLASLVEAMRSNLRLAWEGADMGSAAGLGPSQIRRLFRRHLRTSPRQWLIRERIAHAQSLLLQTPAPLAEVAELSGFCDVYHFGREFRRAVGVAPATWRRSEIGTRGTATADPGPG
jgi:AraC-like DNA-binding protein